MGSVIGHSLTGMGFFIIGLWHFLNSTLLYFKNPNTYVVLSWFPSPVISRYLELYSIILGCTIFVTMELVIEPMGHHPLNQDWTIPFNHLHNFEHAAMCLSFAVYSIFAVVLDKRRPRSHLMLTHLLAAMAFAQELLMIHLHSSDHVGVEGQYHWLLQPLITIQLSATLLMIPYPRSYPVSLLRSLAILFQGVWNTVMGVMLWTPGFMPKGCFLNMEHARLVVRCHDDNMLHRAKSLVNLEFAWYLIGLISIVVLLYMFLDGRFPEESHKYTLGRLTDDNEDLDVVREEGFNNDAPDGFKLDKEFSQRLFVNEAR